MKSNLRFWAIAAIVTLSGLGISAQSAVADHDEYPRAQAGPILSLEQLMRVILQAIPEVEVEEVKLENQGPRGLIYEVELNDDREVYINARTGEILEIDD